MTVSAEASTSHTRELLIRTADAVAFVPGYPPRLGAFLAYERASSADETAAGDESVVVVLPTASRKSVRQRRVKATRLGVLDAITILPALDPDTAGAAEWSAVLAAGLGLIARGRLYPTITPNGLDAWRAGPLDVVDGKLLDELADALPTLAYAVAADGPPPLRLHSPRRLVQQLCDALADALPRTAAAPVVVAAAATRPRREPDRQVAKRAITPEGATPFADMSPVPVAHLSAWLRDTANDLGGARGTDVALRVELEGSGRVPLPDAPGRYLLPGQATTDSLSRVGRAVLQLTSRSESSLVVDAADLYRAPAAVVERFGEDAETELLQTLRRAARAWSPMEPLLHERAPTGIDLDEQLLEELLAVGGATLLGAGIEVLWPKDILADGLALRATVTAAPGVVIGAGLGLDALVEFRWQATLNGELLSEDEIDQLAEAKRRLVRLRGRWVAVDAALIEALRTRRARQLTAAEALGVLLGGSVELEGESVPVVADGPLTELAERLATLVSAPVVDFCAPPGLSSDVELRPYQARGVAWLTAMTATGLGGCLADDMGLGKTLQVIALHLQRVAKGSGGTLVVCPTSLLGNWEREVRRFAPNTPLRRYHGADRSLADLGDDELVITSYGVARRDTSLLDAAAFSLVVADEAQHAKNHESATATALRAIRSPARIALSGTPVENRLAELWSILDWTTPGLLGPFERFTRTVATPIEREREPAATERLARTIRPFLLRRKKSDPEVAPDLPARTVTDLPVPLTAEQTTLYEAEVREALEAIRDKDGIARQGLVLRLLTVLKQICNHPAHYLHQPGPLPGRSGKLAALEELVDVIVAEGESVLIFSQFVECLSLIETRLSELGISTLSLHGKVSATRRTAIVDAFQAGVAPVLLLSLKVGGVGLNLTRATHVVHYDRWWNPAVEDQATDRVHRIGQDRPVQVHRLVAEGTLEDRIGELIERKRSLAEAVVGAGESWIGRLNNDELSELVRLGSGR